MHLHVPIPVVVTALAIPLLYGVARRIGLVDHPGGRKEHVGIVPLVGGIAMTLAFVATQLLAHGPLSSDELVLVAGLVALMLIGVVDDLLELSATAKMPMQVVCVTLMIVYGDVIIDNLGNLLGVGDLRVGFFAIPFTVFAMVGLINAVNMVDGADGMAGVMVATSAFWLAIAAMVAGHTHDALDLVAVVAAVLGFLAYNLFSPLSRRLKVFMGDAGSMVLGVVLAWFAIRVTQLPAPSGFAPPPVIMLWVLGLPVLDTLVIMIHRARQGRSPFAPARDHMHHLCLAAGLSVRETVSLLGLFNVLVGGVGMLGWLLGVPDWALFAGYVLALGLHVAARGYTARRVELLAEVDMRGA